MTSSTHYFFVEIDSFPKRRRVKFISHSVYKENYIIYYKIKTLSPVHVGSGLFKVYNNRLLSVNAHSIQGKLIIPGSTMKGVIAHYHLAVIRNTAKTSSLFGYPGYMSRICFEDVKPDRTNISAKIVDVDMSWQPRKKPPKQNMIKLYRPSLKKTKGKTVQYLECIPEDTIMSSRIIIINSSLEEVTEVLLSMGYAYNGIILIGYGKPKGLGKVRVEDVKVECSTSPSFSLTDKTKEVLSSIEESKKEYKDNIREVFEINV